MDSFFIQEQMKKLCKTSNWRNLVGLIDEGYKGMFVILRILQESGASVASGEIAKQMGVSTARVASALNTLEGKDYIKREKEKSDGRKVVISLTDKGAEALKERQKRVSEMVEPMLKNLTEEEIAVLFGLLYKLLGK